MRSKFGLNELLGAALVTLEVMPDPQNNQGAVMHRVADHVLAKGEIAHCVRLWRFSDTPAHLRKLAKVINARNQIRGDACCSGWVMSCDESTEANKIGDSLLGIDEPHLPTLGGGNSLGLPQDSSHAWTAWPETTMP